MSQTKMMGALIQELTGVIGIPFFVPNEENPNPPNHQPYADISFLWSPPSVYTLGDDGLDEHRGVMQVLLKYPQGDGFGALSEKADAIREGFRAGLKLTYDGQEVTVVNCGAGNQMNYENKFVCPVSIQFYAFTRR